MNLLIVESPNKIKKLVQLLGNGWDVKASVGHICELPNENGVDKTNGFKLNYQIQPDKKSVVKNLQDAVNKCGKENVYLATDPDREGEAISYHLAKTLSLNIKTVNRVTFQEITQAALDKAVKEPRTIDLQLVSAQEARRAIDRLVGFEISPLLWRKIGGNLSAGRVQSVAVRLIVEREREILAFSTSSVFTIEATFKTTGGSLLVGKSKSKFPIATEAKNYLLLCQQKSYKVSAVMSEEKMGNPAPAFNTSSLQQDANRKFKWGVDKTMKVAQSLFESGHITYMRTDSVNLGNEAMQEVEKYIYSTYGKNYHQARKFKNKESAQEAHEAVRPTHFENSNIVATDDEQALYALIYNRTVASQMASKKVDVTTITINSTDTSIEFIATASVTTFDGYTRCYVESENESDAETNADVETVTVISEKITSETNLTIDSVSAKQIYSNAKSRYSEADLVKELERLGIGRPATYGAIINNIKNIRKYIEISNVKGLSVEALSITLTGEHCKEKKSVKSIGASKNKFIPTGTGYQVVDYLIAHFSYIMDYEFTANSETLFDNIAEGKNNYLAVVSEFYQRLEKNLKTADNASEDV